MVFVDTSFFFALASLGDPDHERVREVFETFDPGRLSEQWLTTNHVVFETITLARKLDGIEPPRESVPGSIVRSSGASNGRLQKKNA